MYLVLIKKSIISRTLDKFLVSNRCLKNLFRFLFERQNWLKCERNDTPTAQMCDFITYCYFTFIRNMNFTADCSSGGIGNRASGYLTRTVFQNIDDSNIQRLKSRILIFEQKRLISRRNWENIHRWDHAYNVHVGWNVGRTIHHSPHSILFGGRVPEPDSEARGGERRTVSPLPNARMSEILASTNNVSELNINGDACRMQKEETMISLLSKAIGW